jgi:AcrR family transcriptional regulator
MTATTAVARPGRQRSAAADAAIIDATLALLRDRGYEALTMAAVIERAGVSSATLYRRWTAKSELVAAAVASLVPDEPAEVDTGSLDGDIAAFVREVAGAIKARGHMAELLGGDKKDAELTAALRAKLLTPRIRTLQRILDRAAERDEIASSVSAETLLPLVVGPLHYRATILDEPLSPAFLRRVVHTTVAGLRG